jgi:hypothetical protein
VLVLFLEATIKTPPLTWPTCPTAEKSFDVRETPAEDSCARRLRNQVRSAIDRLGSETILIDKPEQGLEARTGLINQRDKKNARLPQTGI